MLDSSMIKLNSISFPDFEEIIFRLSFELWCVYRNDVNDSSGNVKVERGGLVQAYRDHCVSTSMNIEFRRLGSWGIDFMSPYLTLYKAEIIDVKPNSSSHAPLGDNSSESDSSILDEVFTDLENEPYENSFSSSTRGSPFKFEEARNESVIEEKMSAVKEIVWPLYATYCSCGDSHTPGRLSGPNLMAVLCKVDALSEKMAFSDIGILIHIVSAHSSVPPKFDARQLGKAQPKIDFPSLSYEEFLVYLCSFSRLIYKSDGTTYPPGIKDASQLDYINWFKSWQPIIISCPALERVLSEHILPYFSRNPNLHNVEDSRHRDRLVLLFSIEVLLHVQDLEQQLKHISESLLMAHSLNFPNQFLYEAFSVENMIDLFSRLKIVPYLLPAESLALIIKDLSSISKEGQEIIVQSKWSYFVLVIAFECVEKSLMYSSYLCSVEVTSIDARKKH